MRVRIPIGKFQEAYNKVCEKMAEKEHLDEPNIILDVGPTTLVFRTDDEKPAAVINLPPG